MINLDEEGTSKWIGRAHFRFLFCRRRHDDRAWFIRLRD
jgi:hypothetical protein